MDKRIRGLLLTGAGLLFVVAAPGVVLYAVGYRFIPSDETARPVGVLLVETVPRKVTITVNGVERGISPRAVSGLAEGSVHVQLAKEGYSAWGKELPIEPTKATELRAVKLFAEHQPVQPIASSVAQYSLSPNRRLLAIVDTRERLHIVDVTGEPVRPPIPLTTTPQGLLWSPDSSAIVMQVGNRYVMASAANATQTVQPIQLTGVESLVWDPRLPGRLLALQSSGQLISYSISAASQQILIAHARLFASTSRSLITVEDENQLVWHSLQGDIQKRQVLSGADAITSIAATPAGNIAIQQGERVVVLTQDGDVMEVAPSATLIGWSPDGGMVLVQPGSSELAIFNVENERVPYIPIGQLQSILRLSRPIRHPQWFAGGTHVVFQVEDEIIISEVDTRDHPIQFTVDSTNTGDAAAAVGEDGLSMFYVKLEGGTTSLVTRSLITPEDQ